MVEKVPDYKEYGREELLDVLRNIDRAKYPERAKLAEEALESLPAVESEQEERNDNKALTIFAIGSMEIVFWLVISLLAVVGYSIF